MHADSQIGTARLMGWECFHLSLHQVRGNFVSVWYVGPFDRQSLVIRVAQPTLELYFILTLPRMARPFWPVV